MSFQDTFEEIKKSLSTVDAAQIKHEFAVQVNMSGEGEGIFYIAYKGGNLDVQPYDYKDRDAVMYAEDKILSNVSKGKITFAEALDGGKISMDGDVNFALESLFNQVFEKIEARKAAIKAKKEANAAKAEKEKAAEKSAEKATEKPAAKTETKPEAKAEVKAEAKPVAKPEVKAEVKAEAKPAAKDIFSIEIVAVLLYSLTSCSTSFRKEIMSDCSLPSAITKNSSPPYRPINISLFSPIVLRILLKDLIILSPP
jgi:putative sterol carrier protein